jgi:hypothetical protein
LFNPPVDKEEDEGDGEGEAVDGFDTFDII